MKKLFALSLLALMATIAYAQQPNIADIEEAKRLKVLDMLQAKVGGTGTNGTASNPNEQDCMGAIVVCQTSYYQPNSYSGSGNIPNELPSQSNLTCLGAGELNAVWYKIMVVNDGDLAFNITPNDQSNDYDWAVFNLTNASCGDLTTESLQVSCDFSGSTFPNAVTGPNGGPNSQDEPVIPVHSGEVYYIVVSNFSSSQSGYSIDFSPSTIELGHCSFIYGSVYLDNNTNCDLDPSDNGLQHQVVYALPGPYYSLSDANGLYRIGIPSGLTGTYQLFTQPLSPALVQECPANPSFLTVNVTNTDSLYPGNNFAYIPDPVIANPCPALTVSNASSGLYLLCCGGSRTVRICNNGSATATNVMLDLEYMDNNITLASATYQYTTTPAPYIQVGNHFYFSLPNLAVGECITLDIDEQLLNMNADGQTTCVNAHVTPDAPCGPPSIGWDGSNVSLNSQCSNGTVIFTLLNMGVGNMNSPLNYTVYQGANVIDNGTFQLAAGQNTTRAYAGDGDFFVMQAQQSAGNPYGIQPAGFVENCGDTTFVQSVSYNNFAQGDQPDPIDMDCVTIFNSYDPNDKQAVPSGLGVQHFINSYDDIEYKIRFQNTGTGPAQKVVLVDTLDSHLEILTLQVGASNYDYTAELVGNGVLVFTFNNINLPPASADSLGSIGFITYRIAQKWDNPISYTINNTAYIYFDLNPAIVTNTVFHNVKDNFETALAETIGKNSLGVIIYPNPTQSNITVSLSNLKATETYSLSIYNSAGALVKQQTGLKQTQTMLDVASLSSGLYTYRIVTTAGNSTAGRFVKE